VRRQEAAALVWLWVLKHSKLTLQCSIDFHSSGRLSDYQSGSLLPPHSKGFALPTGINMSDPPSNQGNISAGGTVSVSVLLSGDDNIVNFYAAPVVTYNALHQLPTPPAHFTGREKDRA
jgi:hypothetical protein